MIKSGTLRLQEDQSLEDYLIYGIDDYTILISKSQSCIDNREVIYATKRTILKPKLAKLITSEFLDRNVVRDMTISGVENEAIVLPSDAIEKSGLFINDYNVDLSFGEADIKERSPVEKKEYFPLILTLDETDKFDVSSSVDKIWEKFFKFDGEVCVSEKIHGSQINIVVNINDDDIALQITTKGIIRKGMGDKPYTLNEFLNCDYDKLDKYHKAVYNTKLVSQIEAFIKSTSNVKSLQLVGEVFPTQTGFSYGQDLDEPNLKLFAMRVNSIDGSVDRYLIDKLPDVFADNRLNYKVVPITSEMTLRDFRKYVYEYEQISSKECHYSEGIVISCKTDRLSKLHNYPVKIKLLNDKFNN